MKKFTCIILLLISFTTSRSQTPGPFFRQFLFNPYLFNPAYVGVNEQPEVNLVYRKQWLNFKDAPETTGISLQYPTEGRVSLGVNLFSDKQVLLRNSSFMATFGYTVPISESHALRFGLSGGVGMNRLDLTAEELNTNDPAIISAASNNYYVDGNFGVVYTYEGLRLGFALTEIFKSNPFNSQTFNEFSMANLRNRIYSASFRFDVDIAGDVVAEPYVLYRQSEDGLQDAWEVASMFYIKDRLWTGASYNQNNGLALFLGMNVTDKFRFGYSYEFPPFNTNFTSTSSHEIHLGIKFGRKKSKPLAKTPEEQITVTQTIPEAVPDTVEQAQDEVKAIEPEPDQPVIQQTPVEPVQEEKAPVISDEPVTPVKPVGRPPRSFTLAQGHYVVVGAFSIMAHSTTFSRQLRNQGYEVNVGLNPKKRLYYVYIFSTYDIDEAKRIRNQYRLRHLFREAWVFTADEVKAKEPEPVQPVVQTPVEQTPPPIQEPVIQQTPAEPVQEEKAPVISDEPVTPVKPVGRPPGSFTLAQGHYVVVGAFSIMAHSTTFSRQLRNQGYEVNVGLNPKKRLYYVYIFSSYDIGEARRVRNQYRLRHLFREAWVFTME